MSAAEPASDGETSRGPARLRKTRSLIAAAAQWLLLGAFGAALGYAVWSLSPSAGLAPLVLENLARSGVEHDVTAVIMNFRAYDTLLEMAVLFVALLAVWSVPPAPALRRLEPSAVLRVMHELLAPFLILFAAYLLWAGSAEPGGAFQAGAVLGAALVLAALTADARTLELAPPLQRCLAVAGLATFAAVAFGTLAAGDGLLEYRPNLAKASILVVDAAAAVSIGVTLLALFVGGRPSDRSGGSP